MHQSHGYLLPYLKSLLLCSFSERTLSLFPSMKSHSEWLVCIDVFLAVSHDVNETRPNQTCCIYPTSDTMWKVYTDISFVNTKKDRRPQINVLFFFFKSSCSALKQGQPTALTELRICQLSAIKPNLHHINSKHFIVVRINVYPEPIPKALAHTVDGTAGCLRTHSITPIVML